MRPTPEFLRRAKDAVAAAMADLPPIDGLPPLDDLLPLDLVPPAVPPAAPEAAAPPPPPVTPSPAADEWPRPDDGWPGPPVPPLPPRPQPAAATAPKPSPPAPEPATFDPYGYPIPPASRRRAAAADVGFNEQSVAAGPTRWLWPRRLPRGKLVILSGEPGVGKSRLVTDWAARITSGLMWPDGTPPGEPGDVILYCAEDDAADTIFPRLLAAGGDDDRVHTCQAVRQGPGTHRATTLPKDLDQLARLIDYAINPKLIVFDPLAAYFGAGGEWGGDVQARLAPVTHLAGQYGVTVIAVTHRDLRERPPGTGGRTSRRALADASYLAAARVALHLGIDPADRHLDPCRRRRLLTPIKCNVGPLPGPLAFTIDEDKLAWEGPVTLDPPAPAEPTEVEEAMAWLGEMLKGGPVPVAQVFDQGRQSLFYPSTVRRAARAMGVRARLEGFCGTWKWSLPEIQTRSSTTPENAPQDWAQASRLENSAKNEGQMAQS